MTLKQWNWGKVLSLFSQSRSTLDERSVQSKLLLWEQKLILVILFCKRYAVHHRKRQHVVNTSKNPQNRWQETLRDLCLTWCVGLPAILSSPAQIKMQMAIWVYWVLQQGSKLVWNCTSHPCLLSWGGLKLLLRQTSHRLCQHPDLDQWATGLCKHQRNLSISPVLVWQGLTTKRALGPKAVY